MSRESYLIAPNAEGFEAIREPHKNLVIWTRSPDLGLCLWLESHLAGLSRIETRVPLVDQRLELAPLVQDLPEHPFRAKLLADLEHLGRCFAAQLPSSSRILASLGPVVDDQCRKLHVDWVVLRLLSTYVGPGTEWLPDHAVAREHVGASSCCPADANRAIMRDSQALRRALAGEVLLMKGEAWPNNAGRGVVHRSPPIEGRTVPGPPTRRLVFTLTALAPRSS